MQGSMKRKEQKKRNNGDRERNVKNKTKEETGE